MIKKHLNGGTLRAVMVEEIKRVLTKFSGEDQFVEKVSVELGIAPRTIRVWLGPVEQGGWEELQGKGGAEKLLGTKPKKSKEKRSKLVLKRKKTSQSKAAAVA